MYAIQNVLALLNSVGIPMYTLLLSSEKDDIEVYVDKTCFSGLVTINAVRATYFRNSYNYNYCSLTINLTFFLSVI